MNTSSHRWMLRLLLVNTTVLLLACGCATHNEKSYNKEFDQNLPTSPKYVISDVDKTHFKVTVHQGSPLDGPERITYVKQVASTVAENEAERRGWKNWDLNYIQERDQGWMHIVIAEVARKNAIEKATGSPNDNP